MRPGIQIAISITILVDVANCYGYLIWPYWDIETYAIFNCDEYYYSNIHRIIDANAIIKSDCI